LNEYERQRTNYEKRIRPLFLSALQRQVQPVINWLELNPGSPPLVALIDSQIFVRPMISAYKLTGNLAAKREYYYQRRGNGTKSIIDILSSIWESSINNYATQYAYRITNELSQTTIEIIQNALSYGYSENMNNNQLASYIKKQVQGVISKSRAILIARTESTTAANLGKAEGAQAYFKEQGINGYKEWIGRNDGRERHTHVLNNGVTIPIDQDFEVGADLGQRPGDVNLSAKERCNCRCTVIYMSERAFLRRESQAKFTLGFGYSGAKYMFSNLRFRSYEQAEREAKQRGLYVIGQFVEELPE